MTETVMTVSGLVSVLCACLLAAIVLSNRIQEGLPIKCGLIMMILGLMAGGVITLKGFDSWSGLWNAGLLLRLGLLVVLLGAVWRMAIHKKGAI